MKFVTTAGTTLAGVALLTALAWSAQDAGKPKAQNPPKAKPPAAAPQNGGQTTPPTTPPQDAGDKPKGKERVDADGNPIAVDAGAALSARYAKAAATGDEHRWLGNFTGKWKTATKQMIKPNSPTIESQGTSEFKMLMDGRFLVESSTSAGGAGTAAGMGIIGYNNITGKYERVWFDSHSTAMMKSEGEYIKDRDEVRWTDQWCDPGLAQVVTTHSALKRSPDGKEFSFTQVATMANNEEFVTLSIKYRRGE